MILTDKTWRVLLVDDHPLLRDGLHAAMARLLPHASFWEAGSAREALALQQEHRPELILLDINLPDLNGLEVTRRIRAADARARVLIVSADAAPWTVRDALAAGASGFVVKLLTAECLLQAVTAVLQGERFLCEQSQSALDRAEQLAAAADDAPAPAALSSREREVLVYIAQGENTKNIASLLRISPKTVETHRQHIAAKLRLQTPAALTRYAIRHGLTRV